MIGPGSSSFREICCGKSVGFMSHPGRPAGAGGPSIWAVVEPGFTPPSGPFTLDFHGGHLVNVTESGGNFRLVLGQNVSRCSYTASARDFTYSANVSAKPDAAKAVLVTTEQSDGAKVRSEFSLIVAC